MFGRSQKFVDESLALQLVLTDPVFAAFYKAERGKIITPIKWHEDKTMSKGHLGQAEVQIWPPRILIVHLPQMPIPLEGALTVAHELMHEVLDLEGFPGIPTLQPWEKARIALASLLSDLVINQRLIAYGFNVRLQNQQILDHAREQLRDMKAPLEQGIRLEWIFMTAGLILEYQVATGDKGVGDYQRWFVNRFPKIGSEVARVLTLIRSIGWNTPGEQIDVLHSIIKLYGLKKYGFSVTISDIH